MPTVYPALNIGARARLAMFKREASGKNWARPMTWRDVRFATLKKNSGLMHGGTDKEPIWYTHDALPLGRVEDSHDVLIKIGFSNPDLGYWTDIDCFDTAKGIIVYLPHGRMLAGYCWSSNGESVIYPEIYTEEKEAALQAQRCAERFAEIAREDSYKYRQASDLQQAIEDALIRLRECLVLRHKACMNYVRDEIHDLCESIKRDRARLADDYANYV